MTKQRAVTYPLALAGGGRLKVDLLHGQSSVLLSPNTGSDKSRRLWADRWERTGIPCCLRATSHMSASESNRLGVGVGVAGEEEQDVHGDCSAEHLSLSLSLSLLSSRTYSSHNTSGSDRNGVGLEQGGERTMVSGSGAAVGALFYLYTVSQLAPLSSDK
ncbi:hypothetical protein LZ30DRAFT_380485 [Colletotrichum cereale]|nr:hypothetical protein LZ30DRAFT_380485 [Colletotrichum cereale]